MKCNENNMTVTSMTCFCLYPSKNTLLHHSWKGGGREGGGQERKLFPQEKVSRGIQATISLIWGPVVSLLCPTVPKAPPIKALLMGAPRGPQGVAYQWAPQNTHTNINKSLGSCFGGATARYILLGAIGRTTFFLQRQSNTYLQRTIKYIITWDSQNHKITKHCIQALVIEQVTSSIK